MQHKPPSEMMSLVLKDKEFQKKILYIEGNALEKSDLQRCLTQDAECIVVLSNKLTKNPIIEDYNNIINTHAVKNYVLQKDKRDIRVCIQLLQEKNK